MIKISNLHKSFNENKVLESINLTINDGEIFGLVGESGAGKSTLLNCINRLEIYEEGSIIVDNTEIESLDEIKMREFRKNIGMIFQNFSLVNRKNVYRNIALPMECWGFSKSEIDQKVRFLADKVGITDKLYSKPSELSGGQKQRVAIARALTMNPKYLLSDESTSALDPNTTLSILNLLKDIRNEMGLTIIVVTHEMDVVQNICEKMAIMENGSIVASGSIPEMFLKKPPEFKKLLGDDSFVIPKEGITVRLSLSEALVDEPLLFRLSKVLEYDLNVLDSTFYNFNNKKYASITININSLEIETALKFFNHHKIEYAILENGGI